MHKRLKPIGIAVVNGEHVVKSWPEILAENTDRPIHEVVAIFEKQANAASPTNGAILERAASMANRPVWTLRLQRRRLADTEPEDEEFIFRFWADLEFFILTLWGLSSGEWVD